MDKPSLCSLVGPQATAKSSVPKLRKKLRKNFLKHRSNGSERPSSLSALKDASSNNKRDTANQQRPPVPTQAHPCLPPLATDLSDSKWAKHLWDNGCPSVCIRSPSPPQEGPEGPVQIIPELSHLIIRDTPPPTPPHWHPFSSLSSHSPVSKPSTWTAMRRRAKTPIFSIGQLEKIPRPGNALASERRSSVELIAEQYRALLASRNSISSDSHSEPPPSRQANDLVFEGVKRIQSLEDARQRLRDSVSLSPGRSPTYSIPVSDDGTLIDFEDETVYFKPVSYSSEPTSPLFARQGLAAPSQTPTPANLSLQICLDLLMRDLSSGLRNRSSQPPQSETSALQVWVMIEAYERLRDELLDLRLDYSVLQPLEMMFDMWLRALYAIHDSLTRNDEEMRSESDYGAELGTEELD